MVKRELIVLTRRLKSTRIGVSRCRPDISAPQAAREQQLLGAPHSPGSGGGGCFFLGSPGAALGTSFLGGAVLGGCGGAIGAGWEACLLDFLEGGVAACLGSGAGAGAGPSSPFSSAGFRGGGSLLPFLGAGSSLAAGAAFGPESTLFGAALSLLSFFSLVFDFFSFFFTAGEEEHDYSATGEEKGIYDRRALLCVPQLQVTPKAPES